MKEEGHASHAWAFLGEVESVAWARGILSRLTEYVLSEGRDSFVGRSTGKTFDGIRSVQRGAYLYTAASNASWAASSESWIAFRRLDKGKEGPSTEGTACRLHVTGTRIALRRSDKGKEGLCTRARAFLPKPAVACELITVVSMCTLDEDVTSLFTRTVKLVV